MKGLLVCIASVIAFTLLVWGLASGLVLFVESMRKLGNGRYGPPLTLLIYMSIAALALWAIGFGDILEGKF